MTMAELHVERGIERPVLGALERERVKRLRPNKVSVGSVSAQEQGGSKAWLLTTTPK